MEDRIRQCTGSRGHGTGFTLVELVTVLMIIGVLAVVAVIRWPGPAIDVDAAAEQLAADIRYIQALAMTRHRDHGIEITGNGYSAFAGNNGTAVALGDGTQSRTLTGITLSSSAATFAFGHLLGEPDAGDVVISLSAAGSLREVVVHGATGYTEVQRP